MDLRPRPPFSTEQLDAIEYRRVHAKTGCDFLLSRNWEVPDKVLEANRAYIRGWIHGEAAWYPELGPTPNELNDWLSGLQADAQDEFRGKEFEHFVEQVIDEWRERLPEQVFSKDAAAVRAEKALEALDPGWEREREYLMRSSANGKRPTNSEINNAFSRPVAQISSGFAEQELELFRQYPFANQNRRRQEFCEHLLAALSTKAQSRWETNPNRFTPLRFSTSQLNAIPTMIADAIHSTIAKWEVESFFPGEPSSSNEKQSFEIEAGNAEQSGSEMSTSLPPTNQKLAATSFTGAIKHALAPGIAASEPEENTVGCGKSAGDPELIRGKEWVSLAIADRYLGLTKRRRQQLVRTGVLTTKGAQHHRKIEVASLMKYRPC